MSCIVCKSPITQVMNLGRQAPMQLTASKNPLLPEHNVVIAKCNTCHLVQLENSILRGPRYKIEGETFYRSNQGELVRNELLAVVQHAQDSVIMEPGEKVLDIGCNDGTLLGWYDKRVMTFGVDPCSDAITDGLDLAKIDVGIPEVFTKEVVQVMGVTPKFKIITTVSVFHLIDDPVKFLSDCKELLLPDGVIVIQLSYLGTMLRDLAIDNFCHEHKAYYSLTALVEVVRHADLDMQGIEFSESNGGSVRAYITHKGATIHANNPDQRQQMLMAMTSLQLAEMKNGLCTTEMYPRFMDRIRNVTRILQKQLKKYGPIYAYRASTRASALLQYILRDTEEGIITGVADNDKNKVGKYLVGKWPIVSLEEFRKNAKVCLMLPWFQKDAICKQEEEWVMGGGKFLVPFPSPVIVSSEARIGSQTVGAN